MIVRVRRTQLERMAANLHLADGPDGRRTQDFWLETDRPGVFLCVEKPTEKKCRELLQACSGAFLTIASDPTKGGRKNQIGTNFGSCWLRDEPAASVGDRCICSGIAATALSSRLEEAVESALPALRSIPDGPGTAAPNRPSGAGWSQREELGHLIDSAVNNHVRFVLAASGEASAGPDYDQDAWVAAHAYNDRPWPELVESWRAHNRALVPLVAAIPDARFASMFGVGDNAPVTLATLIEDYLLHMRHHLDQILRRTPATPWPRAGLTGAPSARPRVPPSV